ncbi:transglutaminase-like domain-containing protein [Agrococcus jejuensis]|uniref:transglutaminase-like domain-containing protein n=1 Tax=Agrococcus jejuensis TaxID=399736 RepID=UPI0012F86771|nr:transglutaminase family protein [Agrococcus jejuensis]
MHAQFAMDVDQEADFVLLLLPSRGHAIDESLTLALDGQPVDSREQEGRHGTRELRFAAGPGRLSCTFDASIEGSASSAVDDDPSRYLAASRYAEVEQLRDLASERFGRAEGWAAVDAIVKYVARNLEYDMMRSALDDGAVATLRKRGGMCRDYAHVVIALCRALGIPARYASVYAPALQPPDFHAVAEVHLDGEWWVVDATHLAPRGSMVRIATGIDAEETAWATNSRGWVTLERLVVAAADDALAEDAADDPRERVRLA